MPCPKDKDCIRCGENTFIKGNVDHRNEAQQQLVISQKAEKLAQEAVDAGRYGAQRWVNLHSEKAQRWQMAIDHLTDPSIDEGTLVTLPPVARPQTKSALASAIRDKEADSRNVMVDPDNGHEDVSLMDLWSDDRSI